MVQVRGELLIFQGVTWLNFWEVYFIFRRTNRVWIEGAIGNDREDTLSWDTWRIQPFKDLITMTVFFLDVEYFEYQVNHYFNVFKPCFLAKFKSNSKSPRTPPPYKVQHLHFRYLKWLWIKVLFNGVYRASKFRPVPFRDTSWPMTRSDL